LFAAASLAAPDSNSGFGGFQNRGEKLDERLVGAIFDGRGAQTNLHRASDHAGDFIAARARLNTHREGDRTAREVDGEIESIHSITTLFRTEPAA